MKRTVFLSAALAFAAGLLQGQTTAEEMALNLEKCGGVYYAYPVSESLNTPAPKGFAPFYISHYGRHGSRYLASDNDYKWVVEKMHQALEADALTPYGEKITAQLDTIWEEARGRGGELSPLGYRQQRGIARRMYNAFPEVFASGAEITATSTVFMRCAHSMFAFCEALKEFDPSLAIPMESGQRTMYYMNYHSEESAKYGSNEAPYYQEYRKFRADMTRPDRLMKALFKDSRFVTCYVDPAEMMWGFYWIAADMQNLETRITLTDMFTPRELFDLWQTANFYYYARNSSHPYAEGAFTDNAKHLLENILQTADEYIAEGRHGATLRFGHDSNIIPFTALMRLQGCVAYGTDPYTLYRLWSDYKISPMAGNFQMIFFRNDSGEVIVKFMQNEREVAIPVDSDIYPFYRWEEAREYMRMILDTPSMEFITPE